jgi:hypothetical protein
VLAEDIMTGERHQTVAVQVNEQRLNTSLQMIGRALHFHHFNSPWGGSVKAYPNFLLSLTEPNAQELNVPVAQLAAAVEELVQSEPQYGENPEVFSYQVAQGQPPTKIIMLLRIYEGSRVTLLFREPTLSFNRAGQSCASPIRRTRT